MAPQTLGEVERGTSGIRIVTCIGSVINFVFEA
jgi:hypothetical protein